MADILVLGSLNMDLTLKVKKLPFRGETIYAQEFLKSPGGKGANQAIAAARFGANVKMIGQVGMDQYGEELIANLTVNQVDVSGIIKDAQFSTGIALITVDDIGSNTIVVFPGANNSLTVERISMVEIKKELSKAQAIISQLEIPLNIVEKVFETAKKCFIKTILNPSPICKLSNQILKNTDCIVLNEVEAAVLSNHEVTNPAAAMQAAKILLQFGPQLIILTLGEQGAVFVSADESKYIPAFQIEAVDTTGAGDTFIAVFTTSWLEGKSIDSSLNYASAAAAITVSRRGAQISLPNRDEVEKFLRELY
jgi:ribokinase